MDAKDGHDMWPVGWVYRCVYERAWHTLLSWRVCVVRTAVHVQFVRACLTPDPFARHYLTHPKITSRFLPIYLLNPIKTQVL